MKCDGRGSTKKLSSLNKYTYIKIHQTSNIQTNITKGYNRQVP